MKILMIAPEPFFEARGTPFSVLGRLRALSHLGHEVDLLTYHVGENVVIPGVSISRTLYIPFIQDIPIGPSWKKLFLDVLLFAKAFRFLLRGRYDLLHTHEEASFFGILLAKPFGVRHLYDMHSSLPEQLSNFQYTRFPSLIRLFEWLERRAIDSSDGIITICSALDEHVKRINRNVPRVIIENVMGEADHETVLEEDVRKFQAAHSLGGKSVILYTGTFEPYQGVDLLVASAEHVTRKRDDVMFVLVGGTRKQVDHYGKLANERGLSSRFCLMERRPMHEMPRFIRSATILVSPRIDGVNTPSKLYSYLRSGKPIVATNILAHTQVLTADVAILTEPSPESLADGILRLLEDQQLSTEISLRARQVAQEKYGTQDFIEKTQWMLDRLLPGGGRG